MTIHLNDIIDLDYLLSLDDQRDSVEEKENTLARDREIFTQLDQRGPDQGGQNPRDMDDDALLFSWLEYRRLLFFHEAPKAVKPHVAQILFVMDVTGGCMGNHHVYGAFSPNTKLHPEYDFFHHGIGILIGTAIVPHGPLQTQNIQGPKGDHPGMDVFAPHGVGPGIPNIMVALYIKQGAVQAVTQKRQIFRFHISAGDDQIHRGQSLLFHLAGQILVNKIRQGQKSQVMGFL